MKHWLWYKSDDSIGGEILYPSGWEAMLDLNDATPGAGEAVVKMREMVIGQPTVFVDFAGFVPYVCPCGPEMVYCDCARQANLHYRHASGALEPKPVFEILIDGVVQPFTLGATVTDNNVASQVDVAPGATVNLRVRTKGDSPEPIPDATEFSASTGDVECLPTNPSTLAMVAGETGDVAVTGPAQGQVSIIQVAPSSQKFGYTQAVRIRGWA